MEIETLEQFHAGDDLMKLLKRLDIKNAEKTRDSYNDTHGDAWATCDYCDSLKDDCSCPAYLDADYSEYDDDTSFE